MTGRRLGQCQMCGGCCQTLRMTLLASHLAGQHGSLEEAEAYYSFRGARFAQVDLEGDRVSVEMDIPCSQLTPDNRCSLHGAPEKKPLICHRYPAAPDDVAGCGYRFV